MKLLVLVLLALLGLSSASLQEIVKKSSQHRKVSILNPVLEGRAPELGGLAVVSAPLTPAEFEGQQEQPSSFMFADNVNLEWLTWAGALPNGAVAIYNGYTERTDYVCKYRCESGFYNPSLGPYCRYPYGDQEYYAPEFEILANKDNFEFLEWKEDSHGSVPPHSVRTCPGVGIYVGKNKYGLGKVVAQHEAFFLPWEGDEYWYKSYQVLAINTDGYSQHISQVTYAVDQMELFHHPPETLQLARVTNLECSSLHKTVRLEKSSTVEKTWDIGRQTHNGSVTTMSAKVPILGPGDVDFTEEQTVTFSEGTSMVESISHSVSVELLVPPNHSCAVRMDGRKMTADLPFSGRLSRTNHNGDTHWTTITGTYDGVRLGEINAVVERCQPVPDASPCP